MSTATAMIGLVAFCLVMMVLMIVVFTRVLRTMRTVKLEPERIDDTPFMRCQECGEAWVDGTDPIHNDACAVAYVKGEQRKMIP